jgi:biopolymer transport protein ExbD
MAEMDTSGGGGHKKGPGVKKAKKLSTRVDLTPMVDLGFLLITFFIFTTTMSQPSTMPLNLPKDTEEKDQNKVKESGVLSLLLGKDNIIYYYEGTLLPDGTNFKKTNFKDVRKVIIDKKRSTNPEDFVVVVKPGDASVYKNTVDILDEMTINQVKRYALVDKLFTMEQQLITAAEGGPSLLDQQKAAQQAAQPAN